MFGGLIRDNCSAGMGIVTRLSDKPSDVLAL